MDLGQVAQVLQQVQVALDQGAFGGDPDRAGSVTERLQAAARQAVLAVGGLVRVGAGAQRHPLALPAGTTQLGAQDVHQVDLDENLTLEVGRRELQPLVVATGVAIAAGMTAALVGVEGPAEGHACHAVEGAAAAYLVIADPAHRAPDVRTFLTIERAFWPRKGHGATVTAEGGRLRAWGATREWPRRRAGPRPQAR